MFQICSNKGFKVTFPNGVTLSTQFGPNNYCENKNNACDYGKPMPEQSCSNAEIAIMGPDPDQDWLTREAWKDITGEELGDDVEGYVTPDMWVKLINWCTNH